MTESENIRLRLLKVLRLAQQGVGGERDNAEALLAKLLKKHSLTMADLDGSLDAPAGRVWLEASDVDERSVLSQLAIRLFGTQRKLWTQTGSYNLGLDVSPAEKAALEIAWEVYRAAFVEARHALVLGFCFKHDLYATGDSDSPPMSGEDRERARRAAAMAEILPGVPKPGKRLGSGDG